MRAMTAATLALAISAFAVAPALACPYSMTTADAGVKKPIVTTGTTTTLDERKS
ncbi:hypothetical protein [Consotaella aegiceratis]|uniref:hypothetical protein n=1 Tax=Consotaella aegiceratis TaxID=3097961 RepID=UPI002F3E32A6